MVNGLTVTFKRNTASGIVMLQKSDSSFSNRISHRLDDIILTQVFTYIRTDV